MHIHNLVISLRIIVTMSIEHDYQTRNKHILYINTHII